MAKINHQIAILIPSSCFTGEFYEFYRETSDLSRNYWYRQWMNYPYTLTFLLRTTCLFIIQNYQTLTIAELAGWSILLIPESMILPRDNPTLSGILGLSALSSITNWSDVAKKICAAEIIHLKFVKNRWNYVRLICIGFE